SAAACRARRTSGLVGEELRDVVLAGGGEVVGERLAEEVHAGLESEALAGFVEAGDDLGLHAQGQHLHVGGLTVGVAAADRARLDAALLRLADLPDEVAAVMWSAT